MSPYKTRRIVVDTYIRFILLINSMGRQGFITNK